MTSNSNVNVNLNDYSLYIETVQTGTIGKLMETLHANVSSINLYFTNSNVTSLSSDATGACIFYLRLESTNFDIWHVENNFMAGINIPLLFKLIKDSLKARNTIALFVRKNDQRFYVRVNNSSSSDTSYINLLTLQQQNIEIPRSTSEIGKTSISMNSNAFLQYCKTVAGTGTELVRISTNVEGVESNGYTLTIESYGIANTSGKSIVVGTSQDDLIFRSSGNQNFSELFTLRLCQNIAKACVMSEHVHIYMQPGLPIVFVYDSGNLGQIRFFLFPRDEDLL